MEELDYASKMQLNSKLLDLFRLKLLDKDNFIIPPQGKIYSDRNPINDCLLGSVGCRPDFNDQNPLFSAIGMVFLVEPNSQSNDQINLKINGRFDVSHRYIPDIAEMRSRLNIENKVPLSNQRLFEVYQRHTVCFEDLSLTIPTSRDLEKWSYASSENTLQQALATLEDKLVNDPRIFKKSLLTKNERNVKNTFRWNDDIKTQKDFNDLVSSQVFQDLTKVLPYQVLVRARVRIAPPSMNLTGTKKFLLEIFLENRTTEDEGKYFGNRYPYLLDVEFAAQLSGVSHHKLPHKISPEEYLYKEEDGVDGYGVNTSVERISENVFRTESMPVHDVPLFDNPEPRELGMSTTPNFQMLADEPIPILSDFLAALKKYESEWESRISELSAQSSEDAKASEKDLTGFREEIKNFEDGINLLNGNSNLMSCFKWMNLCMKNAVINQGKSFDGWRLFQLGFVLTQVRSVYERCCDENEISDDDLDFAEVLWFSTGGGKTEAYLGLLCMAMLYERMNGRSYGPTGWMRFPLRMLSAQQFQRLSYIMAEANKIRQTKKLGGHPFTIGYFAGSEDTPNTIDYKDDKNFLPGLKAEDLKRLKFIRDCPYCDAKDSIEVDGDLPTARIKHVCLNPECWSNTEAEQGSYGEGIRGELGIYVSDQEVYRFLPTIMVGTVDKFANIAHNYRFAGFFGADSCFCPKHGFYTNSSKCTWKNFVKDDSGNWTSENCSLGTRENSDGLKTYKINKLSKPGISFLIQDELHLMRQDMGNFDAHYESILETMQMAFGGRKPKILAATATIKDYEHHVNHLYQRHGRRFPAQGFELGTSFYTKMKEDKGIPLIRRSYVGIIPQTKGSIVYKATAKATRRFIAFIDQLLESLKDKSTKASATGSLGFSTSEADLLVDYIEKNLSSSLIYNVPNYSRNEISKHLSAAEIYDSPVFEFHELSGNSSLDEIQESIKHMETRGPKDEPRLILANNVVAHGVDIERLNFLVMSEWPKSTSEYLQSSARAGRVHPGIILVIMDRKHMFQRSIFSDFKDYHKFLDRLVDSVPINRFSPNLIQRTLPGIVSAWIIVWASSQEWGKDMQKRFSQGKRIRVTLNPPPGSTHRPFVELKDKILGTLAAPKYPLSEFDRYVVDKFQDEYRFKVDEVLNSLKNLPPQFDTKGLSDILEELWGSNPMTSLRDIESQMSLDPHARGDVEVLEKLG